LAEKLNKVFGLMRLSDELLVLLLGHHHDSFFALPCDPLWSFGSRPTENFAETGFGTLDLPRAPGGVEIDGRGKARRFLMYFR
jgi:hypothetical protein